MLKLTCVKGFATALYRKVSHWKAWISKTPDTSGFLKDALHTEALNTYSDPREGLVPEGWEFCDDACLLVANAPAVAGGNWWYNCRTCDRSEIIIIRPKE